MTERPTIIDLLEKLEDLHRIGADINAYDGNSGNFQLSEHLRMLNIPKKVKEVIPAEFLTSDVELAIHNHTKIYLNNIEAEVAKLSAQNPVRGLEKFREMSGYIGAIVAPALNKMDDDDDHSMSYDDMLAALGGKKVVKELSAKIQDSIIPLTKTLKKELNDGLKNGMLPEPVGVMKDDSELHNIKTLISDQAYRAANKLDAYEKVLNDVIRISKSLGMGPASEKMIGG